MKKKRLSGNRGKRKLLIVLVLVTAVVLGGCSLLQVGSTLQGDQISVRDVLFSGIREHLKEVVESRQNRESRHNGAAALEGYDEIAAVMDSVMEKYVGETGGVTLEEASRISEEFYQQAQVWEEEGKIISCTWNEEANSVGMTLPTGARMLFAPHIEDTYSGEYGVNTINTVSFAETAISALVNGGFSAKDCGEYIWNARDDCTEWNHLNDDEVSVDNVVALLENMEDSHCRLIFWRGHGNIDEGRSVLELAEEVNDDTTGRYDADIRDGLLIVDATNYWITPGFVERHMPEVSDGGLFFCGSCYSARDNGTLARAFLGKGFQAYVGTSDAVSEIYSDQIMASSARSLCEEDPSSQGETIPILEALNRAKTEHGEKDSLYLSRFLLYERISEDNSQVDGRLGLTNAYISRTDNLEKLDVEGLEKSRTVKAFRLTESEIVHNGFSVVRYNGNDYYWRYKNNSVISTGLFASFSHDADAENEMVCRRSDGTEEVLFTASGNGNFYIIGGRFYLGQGSSGMISGLFSVEFDGSDRVDYPDFYLQCADAEQGLLIGTSGNNLQVIHTEDGSREIIAERYYGYCGTMDGYAYFSGNFSDTMQVGLYRYHLDGSGELQKVDLFTLSDDYRYESANVSIMEISLLDNVLYYSYGYYSGTAGMFQQGGINCVELDKSGQPVSRQNCVEEIHAEEFLVEKTDGNVKIYYENGDSFYGSYVGYWNDYTYAGCQVKDLGSGQVSDSDFELSRAGSYVYRDGEIAMIEENQAAYTTVVPQNLVSSYGCVRNVENENTVVLVRDLERVGNDVYYTVERSVRNLGEDAGWRPSYVRKESIRYRLTMGENQAEELYSY